MSARLLQFPEAARWLADAEERHELRLMVDSAREAVVIARDALGQLHVVHSRGMSPGSLALYGGLLLAESVKQSRARDD